MDKLLWVEYMCQGRFTGRVGQPHAAVAVAKEALDKIQPGSYDIPYGQTAVCQASYKAARLQGYKVARLQGCKVTRLQGYKVKRYGPLVGA